METALGKLIKSSSKLSGIEEPSRKPIITIWAEARAQSDWLVGMNLSPLATIDLQAEDNSLEQKVAIYQFGRVQTSAIRLVCENDLEIRNFTQKNIELRLGIGKWGILYTKIKLKIVKLF